MSKDYYETLGVGKESSKAEIKKAYKKLAMKYHPDRADNDKKTEYEEKFKEVNEAASVLADDEKRANYDRFGSAGPGMGGSAGGQGFGGFDFSDFMSGSNDFDNIFDSLFGGSRGHRRSGPVRGSDLLYDLNISLENAVSGATKTIEVTKLETCSECSGSGAKSKSDIISCSACNGSGTQRRAQRTPFGVFQTSSTCNVCRGKGSVVKVNCSRCGGDGRVKVHKELEVKVPAGIDNGHRLRLKGEGEAGEQGHNGDLYVNISVRSHKLFEREGDDLFLEAPISFSEAALGTEIDVPTIDGKAKLKIPAGTQTHTSFKMKNKGVPSLQGYGSGSQIVKVIIQTPDKLSKKQKELFNDLEKEGKKSGFFDKLRNIFN